MLWSSPELCDKELKLLGISSLIIISHAYSYKMMSMWHIDLYNFDHDLGPVQSYFSFFFQTSRPMYWVSHIYYPDSWHS